MVPTALMERPAPARGRSGAVWSLAWRTCRASPLRLPHAQVDSLLSLSLSISLSQYYYIILFLVSFLILRV